MLSLADLVAAGTIDVDMAAFLLASVSAGASFLIGARPGGAGKTTVMGALLGLLPPGMPIIHTHPSDILRRGLDPKGPKTCYVCHEIGRGRFFAYLWGKDVVDLLRMRQQGATIAANLHADDVAETIRQICSECGAPEESFLKIQILAFLRVGPEGQRRVSHLYWGAGSGHELLWRWEEGRFQRTDAPLPQGLRIEEAREAVEGLLTRGVRSLEKVRQALREAGW